MTYLVPTIPAKIVPIEPIQIHFSGSINTNIDGYKALVDFHRQIDRLRDQTIRLNWQQLAHFDANLSAVLLALMQRVGRNNNVRFQLDAQSLRSKHDVFVRNGLAPAILGTPTVWDSRQSTIPVRRFSIDEINEFSTYIQNDMFCHPRLNTLGMDVKQRIGSYFSELFCNVEIHAGTDEVFVCGQFSPQRRELRFTMIDLGCGFLNKISEHTSGDINNAFDALRWAITGNSTKTLAAGGSGLQNIVKHCLNRSDSVHIITDNCYLQYDPSVCKKIVHSNLNYGLGGTTIHMIFRNL